MSEQNEQSEILPTDSRRVKSFASFFKSYMSVSSILVAALPIPVTAFNGIPIFADHKTPLAIYTSLFCFLALGFIFYLRHTLARWMFTGSVARAGAIEESRIRNIFSELILGGIMPFFQAIRATMIGVLPLLLILASAYLVFLYQTQLNRSVLEIEVI